MMLSQLPKQKKILKEHPDIALILLDVVMETTNAGLDLVKVIRDKLGNKVTQIIIRTGQPGQAPERDVIVSYEINDYKNQNRINFFQALYSCTCQPQGL